MQGTVTVFNDTTVSDVLVASLLAYAGCPLKKCVIGLDSKAIWTFGDCKSLDLAIFEEEAASKETTVYARPFHKALGLVLNVQKIARANPAKFWESKIGWFIEAEKVAKV